MDVYKLAKQFNADYMDKEGNIYKIQKYNKLLSLGVESASIEVYDPEGNYIGVALRLM
jgi:hypothetical protein